MQNMTTAPQEQNLAAALWMLIAVIGFSSTPLFIAYGGGTESPFLFNAGWRLGIVVGCLVYILVNHRYIFLDRKVWKFARKRMVSWAIFWGTISYFDRAFFSWSSQFIDISITLIIYELWPIIMIFLTARLFKEGRYEKLTPRMLVLLALCFVGFVFLTLSQTFLLDRDANGMSAVTLGIGIALALIAAVMVSLTVYSFRWGVDLAREISSYHRKPKASLEMFGAVLGVVASSVIAFPVSAFIGLSAGEKLAIDGFFVSIVAGLFAGAMSTIIWRKANLITHNLGINAIAYMTPIISLIGLFMISKVNVPHPDLLVIGVAAIVTANLLINFEAEVGFGFKSLIIALWVCGVIVYLRPIEDTLYFLENWIWTDTSYFETLTLAATIFTLILSFRVARLVSRTTDEENMTFMLFQKLDSLSRRGVLNRRALQYLMEIDVSEQRPKDIKNAYDNIMNYISSGAAEGDASDGERQHLNEAAAELNSLVHSKKQGLVIGELFALYIFAGISVIISLFSRPDVSGWTAFLTEIFTMLFSSVLIFLLFNVHDLQRARVAAILRETETGDYRVVFRDLHNRALEQCLSVIIVLALGIGYGWLLWGKWLN